MSEENWAVHGGIPACDLCHSRKDLVEKLATLEDAVRSTGVGAPSVTSAPPPAAESNAVSSTGEHISPRPAKRSRTDAGSIGTATSAQDLLLPPDLLPPDSVTSQLHRNDGARDHIEKELTLNESLKSHQKSVFETAIAFIDQLSQAPTSAVEEEVWNLKVSTEFSRGELVQIILASKGLLLQSCPIVPILTPSGQQADADRNRPDMQLFLLDHVPPSALTRMAMCLLEGTASKETLDLCKVIVHFKAALGLYASQLHSPKDPMIRGYVKEMQLRHLNAALTALDAISFMARPTLLLLQALLTGVSYHNIHTRSPENEQEQEIRAVVAWCYHFDRVMSLLLLRPPSLPPLQVPVASLVSYSSHNPMAVFALVMLELVPIHEKLLELTLAGQKRKMSKMEVEPQVDELRKTMDKIYSTIEKARAKIPIANSPDYQLHWHSLEFKFFSTLTAVHRLSNTVCFCASEREKCLYAARRALQCVKAIQDLAKQQDHFLEEFSPYLAWTVLSYPLSPFFVLFCNVVGTSNSRDFQLLQDVVDSVSSLVIENKYVERLRRLCNTLLALCRPLIQQHGNAAVVQEQQAGLLLNFAAGNEAGVTEDVVMPSCMTGEAQEESIETEPWQDDMMWQLFQAQPSLDWFNSDILDLDSWDLSLQS
ncbi:hypothetical protein SLS60_006869 [Paraconiothyrium brasiliense]|uniref:Transcription factor domain-containing protein n=1 Tax=Paraconiothyrium brasiliense TaxID=300254 RepID=A0ABR3R872_9PLEO